jgi:hypothetical protein
MWNEFNQLTGDHFVVEAEKWLLLKRGLRRAFKADTVFGYVKVIVESILGHFHYLDQNDSPLSIL